MNWRTNGVALAFGLLGVGAGLVGWHLWDDHRLIDMIRLDLDRQAKQHQTAPGG